MFSRPALRDVLPRKYQWLQHPLSLARLETGFDPFGAVKSMTAVPSGGQTTLVPKSLHPERDCDLI